MAATDSIDDLKQRGHQLRCRYLLGVADEDITESNRHLVTWATSKLGGKPDFMLAEAAVPRCKICNLCMVLVVQIYAPIDDDEGRRQQPESSYHRTLYVFACLGCCSNASTGCDKSECWRVLRSQQLQPYSTSKDQHSKEPPSAAVDWLESADDWGQMDEDDVELNADDESAIEARARHPHSMHPQNSSASCESDAEEDDDDDQNACPDILDDEHGHQYGSMTKRSPQQQQNRNALDGDKQLRNHANIDEQGNVARQSTVLMGSEDECDEDSSLSDNLQSKLHLSDSMEGAVGLSHECEAEVEPADDDATSVVTVETPSVPSRELIAALFDTMTPSSASSSTMIFKSMFLAVIEEPLVASSGPSVGDHKSRAVVLDDHERGLLASYQRQEGFLNINELYNRSQRLESSGGESYEKYFVKHRDRDFKKFQNRLRLCPQQLLRYCRDAGATPLLLTSAKGDDTLSRGKCANCGCEMVFELQIMPTAVDFIKVEGIQDYALEFGTVVVYTCRASCWSATDESPFVEEKVVVIADPDEVFFEALKRRAE